MKIFVEPEMEVSKLEIADVITTSLNTGDDQLPFG